MPDDGLDTTDVKSTSTLHHSIAGGVSGCLTRLSLQPVDVLKIRFQLQSYVSPKHLIGTKVNGNNVHYSRRKYTNMLQASRTIIQEEGFLALWKGHVPAQLLSILFGLIQFTTYEKCTTLISERFPLQQQILMWKIATPFVCGGTAGVCATIVAHPLDVIRTRLVAQGYPKVYKGMLDAIRQMYAEQGLRTFYKGALPTIIAVFPNGGCHFGFYHLFKAIWRTRFRNTEFSEGNKLESIVCGAASGLVSKVLLLPFDTVKKRLQVVGFEKARQQFGMTTHYNGMIDCCNKILMYEGVTGFYKGTGPSMLKSSLSVALTFFFYEQCCVMLRTFSPAS